MNYLISYTKDVDSQTVIETLSQFGTISYHIPQIQTLALSTAVFNLPQILELDFILTATRDTLHSGSVTAPNDDLWGSMWHLDRINILTAWDKATGAGTKIAIIDAGVSTIHPDLTANLLPGWCVITYTTTVDPVLSHHGTGCAGIAAAVTNNTIGMAGAARDAKIIPVRCSTIDSGAASVGKLAEGIIWAADNGANVCSVSFSVNSDPVVSAAAAYAAALGCVVVCGGPNVDASYIFDLDTTSNFINVCGVNSSNIRQYAYGEWLDLCSPYATTATYSATGYNAFAGNSGTIPVVAGTCALIKELRPELGLEDIKAILRLSANGSIISGDTPGWDASYGAGLLDANAAVTLAQTWVPLISHGPQVAITVPTNAHVVTTGVLTSITAAFTTDETVTALLLYVDGVLKDTQNTPAGSSHTFSYAFETDGPHDVYVVARSAESYLGGYDGVSPTLTVRSLGLAAITSAQEGTSLTISDLPPCKTYEVRARTVNTAGDGPWSLWEPVIVACVAPTAAPVVSILRDVSPTQTTIGFNQASWATSHDYRIGAGVWTLVPSNPFTLDKTGSSQTVEIRGVNAAGVGTSTSVTVEPLATIEVSLIVSDATHTTSSEALTLTVSSFLTVEDATSALTSNQASLTAQSYIATQDATSALTSNQPGLTSQTTIAVEDASHSHNADTFAINSTSNVNLIVNDSLHACSSNYTVFVRPSGDLDAEGYTPVGASTIYECLNEVVPNDTTYITGSSDGVTVDLGNMLDPGTSTGHVVHFRAWASAGWIGVVLQQGVTTIASKYYYGDFPAVPTTDSFTLTPTEADSITDYNDLSLTLSSLIGTTSFSWVAFSVDKPIIDLTSSSDVIISDSTHVHFADGIDLLSSNSANVSVTQANNIISATAIVDIVASSTTQQSDTLSSSAHVDVVGIGTTQQSDILSSSAHVDVVASSSSVQSDTLSSSAAVKISGVFTSQDADTSSSAAAVLIKNVLSATQQSDTLSSSAHVDVVGIGTTQQSDILSSSAEVSIAAGSGTTQDNDTVFGTIGTIFIGNLVTTQQSDILSSSAHVDVVGIGSNQQSDILSSSAHVDVVGIDSTTQASNTSVAQSLVKVIATATNTQSDTLTAVVGAIDYVVLLGNVNQNDNTSSSAASVLIKAVCNSSQNNTLTSESIAKIGSAANYTQVDDVVSSTMMVDVNSGVSVTQSDNVVESNTSLYIVAQSTWTQSNTLSANFNVFTPGAGDVTFTQNDQTLTAKIYYPRAKSTGDITIVEEKLESIVVFRANETVIIS